MEHESLMYVRWYADNMWLFVPVLDKLKQFFATIPHYPFQEGMTLNAGNINYNTLKAMQALKQLEQLKALSAPTN